MRNSSCSRGRKNDKNCKKNRTYMTGMNSKAAKKSKAADNKKKTTKSNETCSNSDCSSKNRKSRCIFYKIISR